MKIAFICSTPYQIFTSINIKYNIFSDDEADIYVFDYFKGYSDICYRLKQCTGFNNVECCDVKKYHNFLSKSDGVFRIFSKIISYFLINKNITRCYKDIKYDKIFYSNQDMINEIFIRSMYRCNRDVEICHFEDGWIDYIFEANHFFSEKTKKINRILKTPKDYFLRNTSYFYQPSFWIDYEKEFERTKKICFSDESRHQINEVFQYSREYDINSNILYFDTLSENLLGASNDFHLEVLNVIGNVYGRESIIIKKHPRNFDDCYEKEKYNVYKMQNIPFEVICNNRDFSKQIIVSTFSTACFSPKILNDQEPYIILLYKLLDNQMIPEQLNSYLQIIKNHYRNSDKIMIPETKQELLTMLRDLKRD